MTDLTITASWDLVCESARSHATLMAANCRREAATLIQREAKAYCDREPPHSQAELDCRKQEAMCLTSRIGSISHADLMARSHPDVSDQIMAAVREFLDRVSINESPYQKAMALTSAISTICHSDMMLPH